MRAPSWWAVAARRLRRDDPTPATPVATPATAGTPGHSPEPELPALVGHEMRNMLTALNGYLALLDDGGMDAPGAVELLARARRVAGRLTALSADLLSGEPPDLGKERIVVARLVLVRELATCVEDFPGLDVAISCPAELVVLADRLRLHQVIVNLVRNAERYGAPPVSVQASPGPGDTVRISVTDGGPGVAEDLVPHLFDYYIRGARSTRPGSGLGLGLVRKLAELQGGSATYDPAGRAFVVTLMAPAPGRGHDSTPAADHPHSATDGTTAG